MKQQPFTAPVYASIHDGWDEECSVVSVWNTTKTAEQKVAELNLRSPGRYFVGSVTHAAGYTPDWY